MRLLYATSIIFPSPRANRLQILSMAQAFSRLLPNDFILGVGANDDMTEINSLCIEVGKNNRSFVLAWKYLRYGASYKITHIYCREEKMLFFMILFNRLFLRTPFIFCYELHHLVYMRAWWHKFLLNRVSYVISITTAMKDVLKRYGYPNDRILVAADAVDIALFDIVIKKEDARNRLGLPLGKKIVIYTGTIDEPWKGAGVFYKASEYFGDDYLFVVVGGKPHYVEEFRMTHSDRPNFLLVGHRPHCEIPRYLKAADVAVLPNSKRNETSRISTSPMKLFEYMASGTPIVASDITSIREILNERNAVLVKADDPGSLATGIKKVIEDKELAKTIASVARVDVSAHTWKSRAECILYFINKS